MLEFISEWWADALFGIIFTFLCSFSGIIWQRVHGVTSGVKALLGYHIKRECEKCITVGNCPTYMKEDIEEMFVSYKKLKGNGTVEALHKRLQELPPS